MPQTTDASSTRMFVLVFGLVLLMLVLFSVSLVLLTEMMDEKCAAMESRIVPGPQGPVGEAGSRGPTGPTGPAGPPGRPAITATAQSHVQIGPVSTYEYAPIVGIDLSPGSWHVWAGAYLSELTEGSYVVYGLSSDPAIGAPGPEFAPGLTVFAQELATPVLSLTLAPVLFHFSQPVTMYLKTASGTLYSIGAFISASKIA